MGSKNIFNPGDVDTLWSEIEALRGYGAKDVDRVLKKLVQGVSLDQPIYRIMPAKYFCESVKNKRLLFVVPEKWDDPYEAALLYGLQLEHHDADLAHTYKNAIVAQCWSVEKECDGLWRVYAKHIGNNCERVPYVQIQTTVRNFMLSILCWDDNRRTSGVLLGGSVAYAASQEILGRMRTLELCGFYGHADGRLVKPHEVAEAYFIKRSAFKYEQEIRFVFIRGESFDGDIFQTCCSPLDAGGIFMPYNPKCIERVILDPWTSKSNDAVAQRERISKMLPFAKVELSDLYQSYICQS